MCYKEGILQAYLDSELDSEQACEITRHLEQCAGCRGALAELQSNDFFAKSCMERYLAGVQETYSTIKDTRSSRNCFSTRLRYNISKLFERGLNAMKLYKK